MAALLQTAPIQGATISADPITRLRRRVQAAVRRQQAIGRPTLICHWVQDADGRLSCQWEIEFPDIPVPPD